MFAYDVDSNWKEVEQERLEKYRLRYQELREQIEQRNIENLADLGEMAYLEQQAAEIMERFRMEAIHEQNEKLSVIAKIAPPASE